MRRWPVGKLLVQVGRKLRAQKLDAFGINFALKGIEFAQAFRTIGIMLVAGKAELTQA